VEKKVEEPPPVEGLSLADALAGAHDCAAGDDGEATPPASPVALDEVVVQLLETPSQPVVAQQPPPPHPEEPFDLYAVLSVIPLSCIKNPCRQCMPPPPPLGSPLPPSLLTLLRPGPHPPHPAFPFPIDPNGHLYRPGERDEATVTRRRHDGLAAAASAAALRDASASAAVASSARLRAVRPAVDRLPPRLTALASPLRAPLHWATRDKRSSLTSSHDVVVA